MNHDKTALLLVDAQVNQFDPPYQVASAQELLPRLQGLVGCFRASGAPVVFVRNCGTPGLDPDERGTPGWELHPSFVPLKGELLLDKTTLDTFESTPLEAELKARGIERVVIAGVQSEYCIRATSLGAVERGFEVTLVSDGHSTLDSKTRKAAEATAAVNAELAGKVKLAQAADVRPDEVAAGTGQGRKP